MTPRPFLVPPCAAFLFAALLAAPAFAQRAAAAPKIPQSPALLGIAAPRVPAGGGGTFFSSSSLQGDGSVANPYIKVQIPGFDKSEAAATSPWKSRRQPDGNGGIFCSAIEPVQVVSTGRQHVRLVPLYRDQQSGVCASAPNCGRNWPLQPVELRQGLIDAGDCAYGSLAFDVRISPNGDDAVVCANPVYLSVLVTEFDPVFGLATHTHSLAIDKVMAGSFGLQTWQRLTFHFALQTPGSLFQLSFRLVGAACPGSGFFVPSAYPATVDLDNVAFDTIPVVVTGPNGTIVSGCPSSVTTCRTFAPQSQSINTYQGVPCTFAQHDSFAPVLCPQSYCQADLDFDGFVDSSDLAILLTDWGTLPTNICQRRFADLDGDQQVGSSDLGVLLSGWGPCP